MKIDNHYFQVFRVASKGLAAQRSALGTATDNLANAQTTRTPDGTPYRTKTSIQTLTAGSRPRFGRMLAQLSKRLTMARTDANHKLPSPRSLSSNRMGAPELSPEAKISESDSTRLEFDPEHPHADENGYVAYPDVNVIEEMATLVSANRLYEANLATVQAMTQLVKRTIDI